MAQRRKFTPQLKTQIVLEMLRVDSSQAELSRRHNIGSDQLSKWKRQFLDNASQVFAGKDSCNGHLERICQLEQLVGKLTLELEISKKALSIFGHPRSSSGSL